MGSESPLRMIGFKIRAGLIRVKQPTNQPTNQHRIQSFGKNRKKFYNPDVCQPHFPNLSRVPGSIKFIYVEIDIFHDLIT